MPGVERHSVEQRGMPGWNGDGPNSHSHPCRVAAMRLGDLRQKTIMRKAFFVISLAALVTAGPIVNANGPVLERLFNYYTDATFTTACGYVDMACGTTYSDGCTTNWRYAELFSCETGEETWSSCQEWRGRRGVNVAPRAPPVTAQVRIHIPGG